MTNKDETKTICKRLEIPYFTRKIAIDEQRQTNLNAVPDAENH